jgi:large subunit ribosomal protein L10
MPKTKDQKKEDVKKLKDNIDKQKSMVFAAYEGLKAADMFNLRKILKEADCKIVVSKKTLLDIAFKDKNIDFKTKDLTGQIALVFSFEDEISAPKMSYKFSKGNENLKILGGFFENKVIDAQSVIALAQIPSREELLAKVVGSISSPVSGFVNVLQGNIRNLVYALSAIKK